MKLRIRFLVSSAFAAVAALVALGQAFEASCDKQLGGDIKKHA
jgi:hypothetical protein